VKVEKIDHIHILVKDLEKATKFFEDILGTKFCDPMVESGGASTVIDPIGLELIASNKPDSAVARTIEKRGEGLAAISLKVPDIEEAVKELQSKGLRLIVKSQSGQLKEAQFHPKDSYGVLIELCEYNLEHGALLAMEKK
jgi:methylmalonyl-CoA/ethylmalonyl-CoA epimerase